MRDEEADRAADRLVTGTKRSEELLAQGQAQLDQLQDLVKNDLSLAGTQTAKQQAYDLVKTRALLTIEESRFLVSMGVSELQGLRSDQAAGPG